MGGENTSIKMANKPPTVVMMVGLQGQVKQLPLVNWHC